MADKLTFTLSIPIQDFDASVLSPNARDTRMPAFRSEASDFLRQCVKRLGGDVQVKVDGDDFVIAWTPAVRKLDPVDRVITMLKSGNYIEGTILLKLLLSMRPDDITIMHNLGMALSDMGKYEQAEQYLRRVLDFVPGHVDSRVALGVALTRQRRHEEAEAELERAVRLDPANPYAQRNLGGVLLMLKKSDAAIEHLQAAARLLPTDQLSWYSLGQALELVDEQKEADDAYLEAIQLDGTNQIAEKARDARSRIAETAFKSVTPGTIRMDAVMYCLGAMERFDNMSRDEIQAITFEIAMLGRHGLDINDSTQKYTLQNQPGRFSGLQLVSIEYVGFKIIDSSLDIGFDLSKEYITAQDLHTMRPSQQ